MSDFLNGPALTAFDAIAIILILVSAVMALARGFIRELSSLISFALGFAAAWAAVTFLGPDVANALPQIPPLYIYGAIAVIAFLLIYVFAAVFGGRFPRYVHGAARIGLFDRLIGLVFGIARGVVVVVGFVLTLIITVPESAIPPWIGEARTYPSFKSGAEYVRTHAPGIAKRLEQTLPESDLTTDR